MVKSFEEKCEMGGKEEIRRMLLEPHSHIHVLIPDERSQVFTRGRPRHHDRILLYLWDKFLEQDLFLTLTINL